MSKIKVAIIGCGCIAESAHIPSYMRCEDAEIKYFCDIIPEKAAMINERKSPIADEYIERYLEEKELDLTATTDGVSAYRDAELIIIATPTNYGPDKNYFDTSSVEDIIEKVKR